MNKLVDYAEEGDTLAHHDDVPEAIREPIYRHEEEEATRRQRKRKASDASQGAVRVCCGHHTGSADGPGRLRDETQGPGRRVDQAKLNFPMAVDEASEAYCDWLCAQVTKQTWQEAYRLACKVTVDKGYDLQRLHTSQSVDAKMLVAHGVLPGIALQYVSRIKEWLGGLAID